MYFLKKQNIFLFVALLSICFGIFLTNTKTIADSVHYDTTPPNSNYRLSKFFSLVPSSNSFIDDKYKQVVVITKDLKQQEGGLYAKEKVDLSEDFTLTGDYYIQTHSGGKLADGIAAVFHNDSRGVAAIGAFGSALGFNGTQEHGSALAYIKHGLVAEMDPWLNSTADSGIKYQHIAWQIPQSGVGSGKSHLDLQKVDLDGNRGKWIPLTITWRKDSKISTSGLFTLQYGKTITRYRTADYRTTFNTQDGLVFFGFVGSTGGSCGDQAVTISDYKNPDSIFITNKDVLDTQGKSINQDTVYRGQTLRYRISVRNPNPRNLAGGLYVIDNLPTNYVEYAGNPVIHTKNGDEKITDDIGGASGKIDYLYKHALASGEEFDLEFDVKVKTDAKIGNIIRNTGYVEARSTGLAMNTNTVTNKIADEPAPETSSKILNRHQIEIPETRYVHNYQHVFYEFGAKNTGINTWNKIDINNILPEKGRYIDDSAYIRIDDGEKEKIAATVDGSTISAEYTKAIESGKKITFGYEMEVAPTEDNSDLINSGADFKLNDGSIVHSKAISRKRKSFLTAATKVLRNETENTDWAQTDSNYTTAFVYGKPGDIINYRVKVGVAALNSEDLNPNTGEGEGVLKDILDKDLELVPGTAKVTYLNGDKELLVDKSANVKKFATDEGYKLTQPLDPMKDDRQETQSVLLEFSAKVKNDLTDEIIKNTGSLLAKNPLTNVDNNKMSNEANVIIANNTGEFKKEVRNVTRNTDFALKTNAVVGDEVSYQLNFSSADINTVNYTDSVIVDKLDRRLNYVSGSLQVVYPDDSTEVPDDSQFKKDGTIKLTKEIPPSGTVKVIFNATVNSNAKLDDQVDNYGTFKSNNTQASSNDAQVIIHEPVPTIKKAVRVGWTGDGNFQDKVSALPGDDILYGLVVNPDPKDNGVLSHLKIKDLLPEGFIPSNSRLALDNTYVTIKDSTGQDIENGVLYFDPSDLATNGGLDIDQIIQANIDDSTISDAPNIKSGDYYEVFVAGNVDNKFFEGDDEPASQGKHIDNVASVVSSSYGDKEVSSNTAVINVSPLKTNITKEVKKASDQDSQYSKHDSTPLSTVIGDKLNYRVTVKPDQSTSRATLSDLTIRDDFNGNLGTNLILNGAEVHYYDQDNNEYPDKAEKYTAEQLENNQYKMTLQSSLKASDYVQIVYDVTVMDDAQTDKVLSNTAYIDGSSYGLNNSDNKRDGWYSNDSDIQVSALGTIVIRYADRETNELIKDATDDKTGKESFTDRIGHDKKVQPKDLGALGYTVVDSSAIDSPDDAIGDIKDWKQPAVDYDLKFDHDIQVITYRYEKSRIGLVAPVLWDFGKFSLSAMDQTYYLKSHQKQTNGTKEPQSVDVIDYYTAKNWTLSVKQLGQFKGTIKTYNPSTSQEISNDYYLDNAQLHLNNGNVTLTDNDEVAENNLGKLTTFGDQTLDPKATQSTALMTTEFAGDDSSDKNDGHDGQYATHGFGTWHYNFGDQETADHSIGLHVPKTTKRHQTKYQTKLEWTLAVAE